MKIFELLRNPIVKTIGVVAILYFALFSNRENPESLGNRWAPHQIKKDLGEMKEKGHFIVANVQMAQEVAKEKEAQKKVMVENAGRISTEDLEVGQGEEKIACGNEAEIAYGIYTQDGKQLQFIDSEKFVIGSNSNQLIEKNIVGMKRDGIRNINIPYGFQNDNKKLMELLKFNATDLKYQITILSFKTTVDPKIACEPAPQTAK